MNAQKEGSLVPWRDGTAFDVVSKGKFKVRDAAAMNDMG